MRFLLDESAELRIATHLRQQGHDVKVSAHDYPSALSDREVLALAYQEQRVLITNDRDFGELIFRHGLPHAGVVYFRLGDQAIATKLAWLDRLLTSYTADLASYLVITDRGVRVRRTG
jgi:predicted nuclease of predicted toxin-antitoxin system